MYYIQNYTFNIFQFLHKTNSFTHINKNFKARCVYAKAISFFLLLFCLIVVNETYAYSPKSLPISQNSDQWQVNIDKPKNKQEYASN